MKTIMFIFAIFFGATFCYSSTNEIEEVNSSRASPFIQKTDYYTFLEFYKIMKTVVHGTVQNDFHDGYEAIFKHYRNRRVEVSSEALIMNLLYRDYSRENIARKQKEMLYFSFSKPNLLAIIKKYRPLVFGRVIEIYPVE